MVDWQRYLIIIVLGLFASCAKREQSYSNACLEYEVSGYNSKDIAYVLFPESYSEKGEPVRLLIRNHGAGLFVKKEYASCFFDFIDRIFLQHGYAVLQVNGIPESERDTTLVSSIGTHMGSPVFIASVESAYNLIVSRYNVCRDGVLLWGDSMGGLGALNMIRNSTIPILGAVLDSPIVDLYADCYTAEKWGRNEYGNVAANSLIKMYDFDNVNFDTYDFYIGDSTFNLKTATVEQLDCLYFANFSKMKDYNPISWSQLPLPPIKIWHGEFDPITSFGKSKEFSERHNIPFVSVASNSHVVVCLRKDIEGNDITINYNGELTNKFLIDQVCWLDSINNGNNKK